MAQDRPRQKLFATGTTDMPGPKYQMTLDFETMIELRVFMLQMKSRLQGDILKYGADDDPDVVEWVKGCKKQLSFAEYIYDAAQSAVLVSEGETCIDCGAFRPRVDGKVHEDGWVCSDCTYDREATAKEEEFFSGELDPSVDLLDDGEDDTECFDAWNNTPDENEGGAK